MVVHYTPGFERTPQGGTFHIIYCADDKSNSLSPGLHTVSPEWEKVTCDRCKEKALTDVLNAYNVPADKLEADAKVSEAEERRRLYKYLENEVGDALARLQDAQHELNTSGAMDANDHRTMHAIEDVVCDAITNAHTALRLIRRNTR